MNVAYLDGWYNECIQIEGNLQVTAFCFYVRFTQCPNLGIQIYR